MDVALRAVSWIWGFHFFAGSEACRDGAFRRRFLRALFLHGDFVVKHLEKADLNGNHYLCDGVGLVFLGCFFRRSQAGRGWLALGRRHRRARDPAADDARRRRLRAVDGLSPARARSVPDRRTSCCDATAKSCRSRAGTRLERMCEFVQAYTKPNGRAPLIGDADDGRVQILGTQDDQRSSVPAVERGDRVRPGRLQGVGGPVLGGDVLAARTANAPDIVRAHCRRTEPGRRRWRFRTAGSTCCAAQGAHLIVDCGEVGMRGRGGHGHNDILSFELFLNGMQRRDRLRRLPLHGVARMAEQVPEHRVPQHRAGRR